MGAIHARSLAASDSIDVVAVVDAVPAVATAVAREVGAVPYSSPGALFDRGDVEAWLVATPTATHPAVVTMAIEAGLHVLCEKPLALDLAESEAVSDLAQSGKRILQLGFWRRFSPPWATART
jgi:myo-inositol 2-dehydrogenase/D-chiro-inositol 1-dehydrogenase